MLYLYLCHNNIELYYQLIMSGLLFIYNFTSIILKQKNTLNINRV